MLVYCLSFVFYVSLSGRGCRSAEGNELVMGGVWAPLHCEYSSSPLDLSSLYCLLIILTWFEIAQMFSGPRAAGILIVADMLVCCGIG